MICLISKDLQTRVVQNHFASPIKAFVSVDEGFFLLYFAFLQFNPALFNDSRFMNQVLRAFPFLLLTFIFFEKTLAQITPQCAVPPPAGAESCQTTCVYCDFNGYTGSNGGTASGGNTVCGLITLHNDQWFGFVAGSQCITINIATSNCMNGDGLQTAFFENCISGNSGNALVCNDGGAGGEGQPLVLSYCDFTPGNTYYLMVDGWTNDVCTYTIEVLSGSITAPLPGQPQPISGPQKVCPGAVAVYSIPEVENTSFYHWTAPPGASINGASNNLNIPAPGGHEVTISFGAANNGQVCVGAANACAPEQKVCINLINKPIPPTVRPKKEVCFENKPYLWDEEPHVELTAPGSYTLTSSPYDSYLGCDSFVTQTIVIKQQNKVKIGLQNICEGECFIFNGNKYCQTGGPYHETFKTALDCDSIVEFSVNVVPTQALIAPIPQIDCANPVLLLNGNGSTSNSNTTYKWTDAAWTPLGTAIMQNINAGGAYHFIVTSAVGSATCRDTATIVVNQNTAPPGATAIGGTIRCNTPAVTLQGSSSVNGANYLWSGPGIGPSNQNQQNPVVSVPGAYVVTVTNPANSCSSLATASVLADTLRPSASVFAGELLTCAKPSVVVDGGTDSATPVWNWTGPGIHAANKNLENPVVTLPGIYAVTVTSTSNGCSATAVDTVFQDITLPVVSAGEDKTITCLSTSVELNGSGSPGSALFQWTGSGITPANQSLPNPLVSQPGTYILTATNPANGCVRRDTMLVTADVLPPIADAGADTLINCYHPTVMLGGSSSSQGSIFTVKWSGTGIFSGNEDLYRPIVGQPDAQYTLVVTNTVNGCTAVDFVAVGLDIDPPLASAGADQTLNCNFPNGLTLSGDGSPFGIVHFLWSGPGIGTNNADLQNPTVTQPGDYILLVTNTVNGCTATDAVQIMSDANLPAANAGQDLVLNCTIKSVNLDGSDSDSSPTISYTWSGPGITPANAADLNPANITTPGTYHLSVTNSSNGCVNTDVVVVTLDTLLPQADAGFTQTLNCLNHQQVTLDASAASTGTKFAYLWTGPGISVGNQNQQSPVITTPGAYVLTVTNLENTCSDTAQVLVSQDIDLPVADAGMDQVIDCVVTSATLGGNSSSGVLYAYEWAGPGMDTLQKNLAQPVVTLPGVYTLLVTNMVNGCVSADTAGVLSTAVYPVANAGADGLLTCAQPNFTLDGTASSTGADFQVTWMGAGITPATQGQISPLIAQPGFYFLEIKNTSNNCAARDTVEVLEDKTAPLALAPAALRLDCQTTSVVLDASQSSTGPEFTFLWSGVGITASSKNEVSPSVTQPDVYNLLISNLKNGCTTSAVVQVTQDTAPPIAHAGTDQLITCSQPTQSLDGTKSSTGPDFSYLWQGPGIHTFNYNLQNPVVADSGAYLLLVTNLLNHCTATDVVLVTQNTEIPKADAGADQMLTCAVTTTSLDGSQSAAGAGISYMWAGPGILPSEQSKINPNITKSGTYILSVTDAANGCTGTDAVDVLEDIVLPIADAGPDLTLTCANSTTGVTLSSVGSSTGPGFTLQWSGPGITPANQNLPNPSVTAVGNYTLTVTNTANGCTDTDTSSVLQDQNVPTASAGPDQMLSCKLQQIALDGSGSTDLGGGITYTWSGPGINAANQSEERPMVSLPGTYTLLVQNSITSCVAMDNVVVGLDDLPPGVAVSTDIITCAKPMGDLKVTTVPATGCSFEWAGPGIGSSNIYSAAFQVGEPGLYSVTVTGPNGCTATATATMELDADVPLGSAEGATLNCVNGGKSAITGLVNTPGASFVWLYPDGIAAQTLQIPVTQPGQYTFLITSQNGCKRSILVNVLSDYAVPAVQLFVGKKLTCAITSVTISSSGTSSGSQFTYKWTSADGHIASGGNSPSPLVDKAGHYTLVVTNQLNGCTNSATVAVENDPLVPALFDLSIKDVRCFGEKNGSITVKNVVGGTPPFLYALDGGASSLTNHYPQLSPGTYTLSLEDANGCTLDSSFVIREPKPLTLELGNDLELQLGDSATVAAQLSYSTPLASVLWNDAPNCDTTGFCTEFTYLPTQTHRHTLTVRDLHGCTATDAVTVLLRKDRLVFVPNILDPASVDPDNLHLMIYGGKGVTKVRRWLIFDRWGSAVFSVQNFLPNDPDYAWEGKVRGEQGAAGVYVWYAEIEFADGTVETFKGDVTVLR